MTSATSNLPDQLRAWAKGSYPLEAAVELLVRAFGGRFADAGNPWIKEAGGDRSWLDADAITDKAIGGLSGGERRLLRIARSMAGGEPVNLNDDIPGLGRGCVQLVLAAIAHAAGSHEHGGIVYDAAKQPVGFERLETLYPWPDGR